MINLILLSLSVLFLLFKTQYVNAQEAITPGRAPIGGKAVHIKETNTIWISSFTKNLPISGNKLFFINLNQSFNTIDPPVMDASFRIRNDQCPVMHFAQALPAQDGVSLNIFGAGSSHNKDNEYYEPNIVLCKFNTVNNNWNRITRPTHALARRNAAFAVAQTGSTYIWGGISDELTGLPPDAPEYPFYWNRNVTIYDESSGWIDGPVYDGPVRTNATMTEISNANAQLVIVGGVYVSNNSAIDMWTNLPLANMSEIIVLDPRYSKWTNVIAKGESPPPRKHHSTILHPDGHTLVVIGGEYHNSSGSYLLNDVWTLDTSNQAYFFWNKIDAGGDTAYFRSNHTSLLIDDQIWVIAGTNASSNAVDIQLLNVTSWTWTSNYNSKLSSQQSSSFASIGGVKGLVGIIVGTVCGALAVIACLLFWWCRRRRINPFSKNKKSNDLPEHDGMVFIPNNGDQQQHYYNSQCQETATEINSKFTSRPSISTTTSGGLALTGVGGNWVNPQQMNSFATASPTSNMISNTYYVPQYTSGPVASPIPISEQYYNNSDSFNSGYFHESRNNSLVPIPGCSGSTTGAVYSSDLNRQMVWDNSAQTQHQPQHMPSLPEITQFVDHDYMLTPMSSRPIARPQPLQKPNEVDPADLIIPSTTASTTVYTSSTNEEDRSVTPGNSNDSILRSPNSGRN